MMKNFTKRVERENRLSPKAKEAETVETDQKVTVIKKVEGWLIPSWKLANLLKDTNYSEKSIDLCSKP